MNNNQSIVKNLLKSTVESECLKLLSELQLVHSCMCMIILLSCSLANKVIMMMMKYRIWAYTQ